MDNELDTLTRARSNAEPGQSDRATTGSAPICRDCSKPANKLTKAGRCYRCQQKAAGRMGGLKSRPKKAVSL